MSSEHYFFSFAFFFFSLCYFFLPEWLFFVVVVVAPLFSCKLSSMLAEAIQPKSQGLSKGSTAAQT